MATCPGLCPTAQETASAALTLSAESMVPIIIIIKFYPLQPQNLTVPNQEIQSNPNQSNPSGPNSVQSIGAANAVSWAIGHNPGWVATSTQNTQMAQSSQQAGIHFADLERMTGRVNPTSY